MRQNNAVVAAVALVALVVGAGVTAAVVTAGPDAGVPDRTDGQSANHPGTQQSGQADVQSPASESVATATQASSHAPGQGGARTVSVSASGGAQTSPDQVTVRVAVVATGDDAPTARQRLAENVSQMRSALSDLGVSDDQIQTSRYDLRQDLRRPPREGEQPQLQYRGEHSFVITVSDTDMTGQIIDTAVTNGANNVEDVEFTLSEDERRSLRQEALRDAMENARGQAETLASASELTITGVHSVATSEGFHRPYLETAAAGGDGGGAPTTVDSGPVGVQVQVQVTYNATAN